MKKRVDILENLDNSKNLINLQSAILAFLFLFLTISFSILLSAKTDKGLVFLDVIFSIVLALIITLFLAWTGIKIQINPHLFLGIGILLLGAGEFALFQRFSGPYTIFFAIISSLITLTYLFERFNKAKNS